MSWTRHIQHKLRLYVTFYTKLNIYTWFPNVVTDLFVVAIDLFVSAGQRNYPAPAPEHT